MTEQYVDSNQSFAPDTRPMSVLAIMSLVLGILFLCFGPLAFFPLGFGIFAITKTGSNGPKRGLGLAIAGTSLGGVGVLGSCLFLPGIFLPALGAARNRANQLLSEANIREVLVGLEDYAVANSGEYPSQDSWSRVLIDGDFVSVEAFESRVDDGDGVLYIYLDDGYEATISQIVIYEDPKHYLDAVIVGFADGHVELVDHAVFEDMLAEQLADQPSP